MPMKRKTFLLIVSPIALIIGSSALFFPAMLLESNGVISSHETQVWMREVGVLLIAMSIILFLSHNQDDSRSLRAILIGNFVVQIGLFLVELLAFQNGIIKDISGIAPNGILHIILSVGFLYFTVKMKVEQRASG